VAGADVRGLRHGDEVLGFCRGAFAQYARAEADKVVPKPVSLTFEQAAAVPMAGTTALRGIRDVGAVRAGHRGLANGAAGGVGTCAVQIAAALGAEVTGVCSTRNVDLVRSIGAAHAIDYTTAARSSLLCREAGQAARNARTSAHLVLQPLLTRLRRAPGGRSPWRLPNEVGCRLCARLAARSVQRSLINDATGGPCCDRNR